MFPNLPELDQLPKHGGGCIMLRFCSIKSSCTLNNVASGDVKLSETWTVCCSERKIIPKQNQANIKTTLLKCLKTKCNQFQAAPPLLIGNELHP